MNKVAFTRPSLKTICMRKMSSSANASSPWRCSLEQQREDETVAEVKRQLEQDRSKTPADLREKGLERTNNNKGYMFLNIGESAEHWLASLPQSQKPLLDLGAAYGVHTIHAIKAGRDVIAVDCDETHIRVLNERVDSFLSEQRDSKYGELVRTTVATLPKGDLCEENSVAGVLLSEVLHFLKPGGPLAVMRDIFRWLEPGGLFVATCASSTCASSVEFSQFSLILYQLRHGRTLAEAKELLREASGEELLDIAPFYMELRTDLEFEAGAYDHLYLWSTKEIGAMARKAGFDVERVEYFSPSKYPQPTKDDEVILLARKPRQ